MISNSGQPIEATFSLNRDGLHFSLVFKADGGSGLNRLNRDYGLGFELLMQRLSSIEAVLHGAYLDSNLAQKLGDEQRRVGPAEETSLLGVDLSALCRAIRSDAAKLDVPGARTAQNKDRKVGGNQTRRLLLKLSTPITYDVRNLRTYLETGLGGDVERMRMVPGETAAAFTQWIEMLRTGESIGKDTWYFASHNIRAKIGPELVKGIPTARFAEGRRGNDWIVEINFPSAPGRENGLSTIAIDPLKRHWLLRQGILHPNRLSGRIEADDFSDRTGLKCVQLEGASRQWYAVEMLDFDATTPLGTLEFVTRCALARDVNNITFPPTEIELYGAPEIAKSYILPASKTSEREIRRRQGEVWEALDELVRQKGGELRKPRHSQGYEVDGLLRLGEKSCLIEIKTTTSAADIYTGVGQLLLYRQIIPKLAGADLVLLLPDSVARLFADAISSHRIKILTYRLDSETPAALEWPAETLKYLGIA